MHNPSKGIWDYHQPDFYRFSRDSIELALNASKAILRKFKPQTHLRVLDLCCGCGVVGFELMSLLPDYQINLGFSEAQPAFYPFIEANIKAYLEIGPERDPSSFNIIRHDIQYCLQIDASEWQYDIVVANPPYYLLGTGKNGPNMNRNLCRFWSEQQRIDFFQFISHALKNNGFAMASFKSFWWQTELGNLNDFNLSLSGEEKLGDLKILEFIKHS